MLALISIQLVQNDKDRLDKIFDASEFLADLLARYANIERRYCHPETSDSRYLEEGIVDVYVAVLRYSAKVKTSQQANMSSKAGFKSRLTQS